MLNYLELLLTPFLLEQLKVDLDRCFLVLSSSYAIGQLIALRTYTMGDCEVTALIKRKKVKGLAPVPLHAKGRILDEEVFDDG